MGLSSFLRREEEREETISAVVGSSGMAVVMSLLVISKVHLLSGEDLRASM